MCGLITGRMNLQRCCHVKEALQLSLRVSDHLAILWRAERIQLLLDALHSLVDAQEPPIDRTADRRMLLPQLFVIPLHVFDNRFAANAHPKDPLALVLDLFHQLLSRIDEQFILDSALVIL